jgi:CubicO group peptidase (beta-lactamase class C family)
MTAVLFARLVESGRATWQDSVADLLGDAGPHPAWGGVTVTDLLTHFAGLPANLTRAQMKAAYAATEPETDQRAEVARWALSRPPVKPGHFRYSNLSYTLAGAAIERITKLSYQDALRREVLEPLGISSAGFGAPSGEAPWGHPPRRLLYGKGKPVRPDDISLPQPADNPPVITPAGRLHISLPDWARFIRLFLRGGPGLLTADSLDRITTPPAGRKSLQGMGWAVPATGSPYAYLQQGSNLRWVATARVDTDRRRAALVATNDGRLSLFRPNLRLAAELLAQSSA